MITAWTSQTSLLQESGKGSQAHPPLFCLVWSMELISIMGFVLRSIRHAYLTKQRGTFEAMVQRNSTDWTLSGFVASYGGCSV